MTGTDTDRALYRTCVYPLVLFLLFTLLQAIIEECWKWDHPSAEWWQRAPELWIYPLQTLLCGGWLWHIRKEISWDWNCRASILGAALGVIGITLWLIPYFLGWAPSEGGFEPERYLGEQSIATYIEYTMRLLRAVVVVPLAEELFWRGFLMRWCINRDFPQNVPLGQHSWKAWAITTLLFMLAHHPIDYAAAICYGSLAYWLVVRTRRLTPAILMHATANMIMGICALRFNLPQLW